MINNFDEKSSNKRIVCFVKLEEQTGPDYKWADGAFALGLRE